MFARQIFSGRLFARKRRIKPVDSPLAADFADLARLAHRPSAPVNFQRRTAEQVAAAAAYALTSTGNLRDTFEHYRIGLEGKHLLEIGPGSGFGSTLLLGESCARLTVADRFLAPWQDDFHPRLYAEISRLLGQPSRRLDTVIRQGGYDNVLHRVHEPAHALRSVADRDVDVILSNAVLEHVDQLETALAEFFRVTVPGGLGFHQVDFRNHRNFDLPLEHLLLDPDDFRLVLKATNSEIGCQYRVREVAGFFEKAGFEVRDVYVSALAPAPYLDDFEPRLRRSASAYRDWPLDELARINASFFVARPAA